jgi:hypothetical protein
MTELMEESHYIVMREQRRGIRSGFREIADTGRYCNLLGVWERCTLQSRASGLQGEASSMTVFAFTWEKVKVEVAHQLLSRSSFSIVYRVHCYSRSPDLSALNFSEFEM